MDVGHVSENALLYDITQSNNYESIWTSLTF